MTKLDEFAARYSDVYEFLVDLEGKVENKPILCNCDGEYTPDGGIQGTTCPYHIAARLLKQLEEK